MFDTGNKTWIEMNTVKTKVSSPCGRHCCQCKKKLKKY